MRLTQLRSSRSIGSGQPPRLIAAGLCCFLLASCGGDSGNPATYTVSATISNLLANTSVVLSDNGADSLTASTNGTVAFAKPVASGAAYSVTVATQPTGQTCSVSQGSGTVSSFNINVAVTCSPRAYQIGGSVSGLLTGNSVALSVTAGANSTGATIKANGAFTFNLAALSGSAYAVTVATQPTGQTCAISNGSGTVAGANITNVAVNCAANTYAISATVTGLANVAGLMLQDNGTDTVTVTGAGNYPFKTQIPSGSSYAVTISTQPAGHTCIVQNGSGTMTSANITVSVVCPQDVLYSVYSNSVTASYIDETTGALVPVTGSPFAAGNTPYSIVLTPNGSFAYVVNFGDDTVSAYSIDPVTGALSGIAGSPFAVGGAPLSVAITPNGSILYVLTATGPSNLSSFNVNPSTGALTPTAAGSFAVDASATVAAVDPTGKFAYVVTPGTITAYTVDNATGGLTPIVNGLISNGGVALAFDPIGGFIYVSGNIASLYAYAMNATTGLLTAVPGSPYTTEQFPTGLAVSPNGQFLYVPAQGANQVMGYTINSSGTLAPMTGSPFGSGRNGAMPEAIIVDPSGKYAYGDVGDISIYTVSAGTGALSFVNLQNNSVSGGPIRPFAIGSIH